MQAPIIVFYKVVTRQHVDNHELLATGITFIGSIIMNFDTKAEKGNSEATNILFGNSIALLSGICGVFAVVLSKELCKFIPSRKLTLG
jgi:drug/metabolite transporter (DMT)-like permease